MTMAEDKSIARCGCGGYGEVKKHLMYRARPQYFVACNHCGTRTVKQQSETEAVRIWNEAMSADLVIEVPDDDENAR